MAGLPGRSSIDRSSAKLRLMQTSYKHFNKSFMRHLLLVYDQLEVPPVGFSNFGEVFEEGVTFRFLLTRTSSFVFTDHREI